MRNTLPLQLQLVRLLIALRFFARLTTHYHPHIFKGTSMSTSIPYFSAYPHSVGVNIGMSSTVPSQSTKTKIPQTPPVDRPPSPPDLVSSITPNIASKAMRRIICQELREAGFNSAQASVVQKLEFEVVAREWSQ